MKKKISLILAFAMAATMLAGCKKTDEDSAGLPETATTTAMAELTQMTVAETEATTVPEVTMPEETTTTAEETTVAESETEAETTTVSETETEAETTTVSASETAETTTAAEWNETEISETYYIASNCYSRKKAIVGSESVKQYKAGTEINIVAATDTGYYKLADGTFIHSDYVTDEKPAAVTTAPKKEEDTEATTTKKKDNSSSKKPVSTSYKVSYEDRYPYQQLSSEEKELYRNMVESAENFETTVVVPSGVRGDTIDKVYTILFNNEPQLFWLSTSYPSFSFATGNLELEFVIDRDEAEAVQKEIDATVADVMAVVGGYSQTVSRLKAIYDWVITNNDFSLQGNFETCGVYDSLTGGGSLQCQGYAKTFQYLCDVAGIECMVVNGNNTEGSTHAWNVVYCENGYYIVDTTWGDPILSYAKSNYVKYNFFLANDEMIKDTHLNQGAPVRNSGSALYLYDAPACTKTACYYFKAYNKEYDDLDSAVKGMYAEIDAALESGKNVAHIRVTDYDLWETLTSKEYWSKFQNYAKSKSSKVTATTRQTINAEGCLVVHYDLKY
ncbi:MAG: hypothetical protein J6K17_04745 [Oscillospiraceae bacterium]|nr:hypothetical protein [Oscillospiraceae bacterium]